jgi:type I restriction enzyme, S subunit
MSNERDELPDDWRWIRIADACETTSGGTPSRQKAEYFGGDIPWVKSGELEDGLIRKTEETITKQGLANSSAKVFPAGTPLVALYGATVGRTGLLGIDAATNQAVCALFPKATTLSPHFLLRYLQSQRQNLVDASTGGAQPNISQKIIRDWPLPLAPLDEQHRIVAKIEQLFAESRTAREALDGVPALIKRFRQAVLAKAFRGELTERDPSDEPASALLERIRAERKTKSEGRKSKKDNEPEPPDISGLPELPEGWCWATTEMLAADAPYSFTDGPFGSNLKTEDYVDTGVRVIRLQNLGVSEFKNQVKAYVTQEKFELLRKHEAIAGDVIIAALAEPVGRACLVPEGLGTAIVKADCVRLRVDSRLADNKYVMLSLNTPDHFKRAADAAHGVGRLRANFSDIKAFAVPLAPLAEQRRIVAKIEMLFAQADAIETAVNIARQRAEKLDQAILARAFRGEL